MRDNGGQNRGYRGRLVDHHLFATTKAFIAVVHLPPLPGSPRWSGDMEEVLSRVASEAQTLESGGADAIIVENFGDAPFRIGRVEAETVASMALAVQRVLQATKLPVGINILRNDAQSAMAVAAVTGTDFIRVNVHYGIMAADEGLVEGEAYQTLRQRRSLGVDVKILADVMVKHAVALGPTDLGLIARETVYRGLADGLIISGPVTGQPASGSDVTVARKAVPDGFILVGSGVNESNAPYLLADANGAIIGTSLKRDGVIRNPIEPERVKRMGELIHAMR